MNVMAFQRTSTAPDERPSDLADHLRRLLPDQVEEHAVILLDPHGRIVAWLSGAERIFGYSAAEVVGKPVSMLFAPEDIEKGMPEFERKTATQDGHAEDDRWMARKDGLRFWANGVLSPLRNHEGQVIGFGKVLRNRTDLKGQIEGLGKRISSLEKADERKNAFIATLSHELRNPLVSLFNALELLRRSPPVNDATAFAISTIERQIEAMRRLIEDILDMTRIGVGKVQLQKRHVALGDIIKEAIESCHRSIDERTHELKLVLPDDTVTVNADPDRMQQVFVNLLQNAAKYTEFGGNVWVKLNVEGKEAVVKVEDTGIGISKDVLPRIFDLFTQAEFASDRGGLGIGLSVVKDLVTLHGGSVQVRSDGIGKGSEFTVRLPLAGPDEDRPDEPTTVA
jgi:PAS domain S-box-containing protein